MLLASKPRHPCGNCSSSAHNSRDQNCPTCGQSCRNCGKLNHFAKVCKSAPADTQRYVPITIIHNVSSGREAFKTCTLMIDEDSLQLLLNTRANVSLLNLERYRQFFSHQPLGTPSTALCGCANFKIDIVGSLQLPLKYGENLHCRHPVAATAPCTGMPLLLCTPAPD